MQQDKNGRKGIMVGIAGMLVTLERHSMKRSRKRTVTLEEGTIEPGELFLKQRDGNSGRR